MISSIYNHVGLMTSATHQEEKTITFVFEVKVDTSQLCARNFLREQSTHTHTHISGAYAET